MFAPSSNRNPETAETIPGRSAQETSRRAEWCGTSTAVTRPKYRRFRGDAGPRRRRAPSGAPVLSGAPPGTRQHLGTASHALRCELRGRPAHARRRTGRTGVAATSMARRADIASALAAAYLAGVWNEDGLVRRSATAIATRPRWLRAVAREVLAAYPRPPADRPRELARFVAMALDPPGRARRATGRVRVVRMAPVRPGMGRTPWPVPAIATAGE